MEAFEVSGGRGGKLLLTNLSCFLYNLFHAFDSDQFAKGLVVCVFKGKTAAVFYLQIIREVFSALEMRIRVL